MIVAHPDDETLWGGGHLKGGHYFIICLTNGYQPTRNKEFHKVLKLSGSRGVILNYPDLTHGMKNNWSAVRPGIRRDIDRAVTYKNWQQIVTYNPDGVTGHIHHLMTYADVHRACLRHHLTDKLVYFGTYYRKGEVPANLKKMSTADIAFKNKLINCYQREMDDINHYWRQMLPYENWIAAKDWV